MNSPQPESEIVRRIAASDETAFRNLYVIYAESLFRYFWSRLADPELARDFVQELFTRVWSHRARLDPDRSIKRYLYTIAENLLIDHFRRQDNRNAYLREKKYRLSRLSGDENDLAFQLELAIESLPEKLRTTFLLSRRQDLTHAEIAAIFHVSVKAVEKRMKKAMNHLRKVLS